MPDNGPIYQTLNDFVMHPFGKPYNEKGASMRKSYDKLQSILRIDCFSILDDSYYLHIKVPSESTAGKFYDVVLQFLPPDAATAKQATLDNYVIQFFSNSPSFIYKYAVLYKQKGYMIDALQSKLNPDYKNTLPKNVETLELDMDKSIYLATTFLYEGRVTYLSKSALRYQHKVSFKDLARSVLSATAMANVSTSDVEEQARKEGREDQRNVEKIQKTTAKKRTPGISTVAKTAVKKAALQTSGLSGITTVAKVAKRAKITAKKSTKRT